VRRIATRRWKRTLLGVLAAFAFALLVAAASAVDVVIDEPPLTAAATCAEEEELESRGATAIDLPPCLIVRSTADKATVAPDPRVELEVDESAVPGDPVAHRIEVHNDQLTLELAGQLAALNTSSQALTVQAYHAYVEYKRVGGLSWERLGVAEGAAPGYAPAKPAPPGAPMESFDPAPRNAPPVTYPASGDRIVGTTMPAGLLAYWDYEASIRLSAADVEMLHDPERTEKIRFIFRAETTRPPTPAGYRELEGRTSVAYMAKQLRPQTGELRDLEVALETVSGEERIFGASDYPELARLDPGASASFTASDAFDAPPPRGVGEAQSAYLARLDAAAAEVHDASARVAARADGATNAVRRPDDVLGVDTDPTDNDIDVDPATGDVVIWEGEYETSQDPARSVTSDEVDATTSTRIPVLGLEKTGPPEIASGALATYELHIDNTGGATAEITELSDRLTEPQGRFQPAPDAPQALEPGAGAIAHVSHEANAARATLADQARLRWSDRNGNPYGPLTDAFTSTIARTSSDASPLDPTVAANMFDATAFLYSGPDPLQQGVAAGAIEPARAAVVRGVVADRVGAPLEGVAVSAVEFPEYGSTLTEADGTFSLAVNGGTAIRLRYEKAGYLPVERTLEPPAHDYSWADDVVMVEPDPQVSEIDLSAPSQPIQVARGSEVTDADGSRRATLMFSAGTEADMEMPDGSSEPLPELSVRATEYTVGASGEAAMPAALPPTSGYTYAVELSADEAVAAGAQSVEFSQPVISYTENFVGWPVGEAVPAGYYDSERGAWVAAPDGRVVEILSEPGGVAELDLDGSGQPADSQALADLGISTAEREQLAALYAPGDELWRVAVEHFTPWDYNGPIWIPASAEYPGGEMPPDAPDQGCESSGSVIECESQVLGEDLALTGSELGLHYRSDRAQGRKAVVRIPVTGPSLPAGLEEVKLELTVAGRRFTESLPAQPDQVYEFEWDRRDAFGRLLQGRQRLVIRIGYVYAGATYARPAPGGRSFAQAGTEPMTSAYRGKAILWSEVVRRIGGFDAKPLGLGGWTLTNHHVYDPQSGSLFLGDGSRRQVQPLTVETAAGGGTEQTELGTAAGMRLESPEGMDWGADGSLYFAEFYTDRVRRVAPDGELTTVAGSTPFAEAQSGGGYSGDGGPATQARINAPTDVKVAPDGTLYIADYLNGRVRAVAPDGTITTLAGGGTNYPVPDGSLATNAELRYPTHLDVAADGSVYVADRGNFAIYRIDPSGRIFTIAGGGPTNIYPSGPGDEIDARDLWLRNLRGMALAPDGTVYASSAEDGRYVFEITPQGRARIYAGGNGAGFSGDGGPATAAQLHTPKDIEVAADGSVYITDAGLTDRVRRVDQSGTISTVVGGGPERTGHFVSGMPATELDLSSPNNVAFAPDGTLHVSSWGDDRVLRVASPFPGFDGAGLSIASEDGSEVYEFSAQGRHLRTRSALTGATLYEFFYDPAGRLEATEDGDGNTTEIERDASGAPDAIVAPFGRRTELSVDGDSFLDQVENPAAEDFVMQSSATGLLHSLTDPRGNEAEFTYDAAGRLVRDDDRGAGFKTLDRSEDRDSFTVELATKMGRSRAHEVKDLGTGGTLRTVTDPAGLQTTLRTSADQGSSTLTLPDGTSVTRSRAGDPRFGMQAPYASRTKLATPGGRQLVVEGQVSVELANPSDPLSLESLTQTLKLDGRSYTTGFDAEADRFTSTTPAGRTAQASIDDQGRVLSQVLPGIEPTAYSYDERGRLVGASQGDRDWTLAYEADGDLDAITDPVGRTHSFDYDDAGRLIRQTLPGAREIVYSYDANGNLTSVTPPGRSAHAFSHNALDDPGSYAPPGLGDGAVPTTFSYNDDHQLTGLTRPDGSEVALAYDSAGRLDSLTEPGGALTDLRYSPQSGKVDRLTSPGGVTLDLAYDGPLATSQALSGPVSGSVSHAFDNDFRVAETKVNGADPIAYGYDADSLLTGAGELALGRSAQTGRLASTTLSSLTSAHAYNPYGEPESTSFSRSGNQIYAVAYERDAAGRVTEKAEATASDTDTWTYAYDDDGRLESVERDGQPYATYAYDQNGNRLSEIGPTGTTSGTYDAQDRLESWGETTYEHDQNGQLAAKTDATGTTSYDYDALGNLDSVELPDGTEIAYVTDGLGRRIARKVDGQLTHGFLYGADALGPAAELNAQGAVRTRFVYATSPYAPDYMVRQGTTYRIVRDQLGSVRLVVDAQSGQAAQEITYGPFGEVLSDTNPGFQPFGFAGGLYDPETGLVRFGARDYDAETGRWTAKDPILFAGGQANLYGYVLNDPVNLVDPSGLGCVVGLIGCGPEDDPCDSVLNAPLCAVPAGHAQDAVVNATAAYGDGISRVPDIPLVDLPGDIEGSSGTYWLRGQLGLNCDVNPKDSTYKFFDFLGQITRPARAVGGRLPKVPERHPREPFPPTAPPRDVPGLEG
jgi:RHS repeat-associated protein